MSVDLEFDIPTPPSINHLYERGKYGQTKTSAYRSWLGAAQWMLIHQRKRQARHRLITHNVAVEVQCYRHPKTPDLDNILKPIMDLLMHSQTIKDDKQVVAIVARYVDEGVPCTIKVRSA